jgi:hypothetical protein
MASNENPPENMNPWDGEIAGVNVPCRHEWVDIVDGAVEEGFGCVACQQAWGHNEATEVLMSSANHFASHLVNRLTALEELVSSRFDITFCAGCEGWFERSSLVDLGPWFACPEHVANSLDEDPMEPEPLRRAVAYVKDAGIHADATLAGRTRWEQMVAASPTLAALLSDADDRRAETRGVKLPRRVSAALGLGATTPFGELAGTVAQLSDAAVPTSRSAMGYLIGLLDAATRLTKKAKNPDALDDGVEAELLELAWRYDGQFAEIAAELCGEGKSLEAGFDTDIAAQALALLSRRCMFHLVAKLAAA